MSAGCCIQESSVEEIRSRLVDEQTAVQVAETFKVLSDPSRVRILHALSQADELCVRHLCALVRMTPSAVSHQLRLIRGMNLVATRRQGQMVFYRLSDGRITKLLDQVMG